MNVSGVLPGLGIVQSVMNQAQNHKKETKKTEESVDLSEEQGGVPVRYTLHYFDDTDGNTAISAQSLSSGGSTTVYKPIDFNPAEPEYLVKVWDCEGNVTSERISLGKVNPENATYLEMYAYACYQEEKGIVKDAIGSFTASTADMQFSGKDLDTKYNFKDIVYNFMNQQGMTGNWQRYLEIKEFYDYMEEHPYKENQTEKVEETENVHTPFDKFDGLKHAPYYELADESGVISYNGVTFVCDNAHGALCLGDMSDESNVIRIPLAGGGCLKVNRDNKEELARAIGMFSPEDVRRIMVALAQDNKIQQMEYEIEDDKNSIGDTSQNMEATGDTQLSESFHQSDVFKNMWQNYFDGAADEVEKAWKETMNETGIDGFGFDSSGKLTHISQYIIQRLLTDKNDSVFGNSVASAYSFAKDSLEKLSREIKDMSGKTKEVSEAYWQEWEFYRVFTEKLETQSE